MTDATPSIVEPTTHKGPNPILVRNNAKESWSKARTINVLKDMVPAVLSSWIDGMNVEAGFAKYRAA